MSTGLTCDVPARLAEHNAGRCRHTAGGRPWRVEVTVEFADEQRAAQFERYLKSGSGCAFARRHLREASTGANRLDKTAVVFTPRSDAIRRADPR